MAYPTSFSVVAVAVFPLALAAAVSPLVLVGQLFNLTQPGAGLRQGWSYAAGTAVVVALRLAMGLPLAGALPTRHPGPDPVTSGVRLMLVMSLIALLPPLTVALTGALGHRALQRLGAWTKAHQRPIATFCFVFVQMLG